MTAASAIPLAVLAQCLLIGLGAALAVALVGKAKRSNPLPLAAVYPLGAVAMSSGMVIAGIAGVPFRRSWLAIGLIVASGAAIALSRRSAAVDAAVIEPAPLPRLPSFAPAALAALLATKVLFVFSELLRLPITGWDSFAVWSLRARVWAAREGLVLDRGDPFFLGGAARNDYPPHVSLLQTWTGIWVGEWNDVVVNMPWGFYYLSLLVFTHVFVARRLPRDWALAATFAMAGLPLLVVHAALGGYADLILATHFLLAVAFLHETRLSPGSRSLRIVAWTFVLSLPLIKLEGIVLALACLMTMALAARPGRARRHGWLLVFGIGIGGVALALFNPTLRGFLASTTVHTRAGWMLLDGLFRGGSWHMLWPVFIVVAIARLRAIWGTALGWMLFNIAAALPPLLFALLFTDASKFVLQRSADSRLFLGIAPAALVFVVLAIGDAADRRAGRVASGVPEPTTAGAPAAPS